MSLTPRDEFNPRRWVQLLEMSLTPSSGWIERWIFPWTPWQCSSRSWTLFYIYIKLYLFLSVCLFLFVCPILTNKPQTDLPQIFVEDLERTTGMFLTWFWDFKLSGSTFIWKKNYNRNLRKNAGLTMTTLGNDGF